MKRRNTQAVILIGIVGVLVSSGISVAMPTDEECLVCHGDPNLVNARSRSLYVDKDIFAKTVHGSNGCVSCHTGIGELPHADALKPVDCGSCHDQAKVYAESLHGKALVHGDKDVAACQDCHGKHDIRPTKDPLSLTHPRNLPQTCGRCHSNPALVKGHMVSVVDPSQSYLKSIHARSIAGGAIAATCSSCHGAHDLLPSQDPKSKVNRMNIAATCGQCHLEERKEFENSIHGKALAAGFRDAPTCVDCHGEHDIEESAAQVSATNPQHLSIRTCSKCHAKEEVMSRYGVPIRTQASYLDSYHGVSSKSSSTVVANCTSCHGVHRILPSSDSNSSVNAANLPQTCGQVNCHEGAGANFASSPVHIVPTAPGQKVLGIVRLIYITLIVVTLGGMVAHNTALTLRHLVVKIWKEVTATNTYRRFTRGQTLGHMALALSFIVLVISGFALRYPGSWWAKMMFYGENGFDIRGIAHRIAAVVLIVVTMINLLYVTCFRSGRKELVALSPRLHDIKDAFHNIFYAVGIARKAPRFDRYSYIEKLEYWGMLWGSAIMIVTGFCMWFPDAFLHYLPKIVLDVAALIHYYEAWLAFGTIILWHFYFIIFDPESYPMNWSWLTGRISEEDFKGNHPLEHERVMREKGKKQAESILSGHGQQEGMEK